MIHSQEETEHTACSLLVTREAQDVLKFLIRFFNSTKKWVFL